MMRFKLVTLGLSAILTFLSATMELKAADNDAAYALSLWQNGRSAFDANRWSEATAYFERLTTLYPSDTHALEAQKFLGLTWLEDGQPDKAIAPLRSYVERKRGSAPSAETSLDLGRAYLQSGKPHEAILLSEELLKKAKGELRIRGLLLKTGALIAMNRDARAALTSASAAKETENLSGAPASLRAAGALLQLRLKLRSCGKFADTDHLDEGAAQSQLQRRGICLQESLTDYRKVLASGILRTGREATRLLDEAWESYRLRCVSPPGPQAARTQAQLQLYKQELSRKLLVDLSVNLTKSRDILNSLKDRLPGDMLPLLKEALQ